MSSSASQADIRRGFGFGCGNIVAQRDGVCTMYSRRRKEKKRMKNVVVNGGGSIKVEVEHFIYFHHYHFTFLLADRSFGFMRVKGAGRKARQLLKKDTFMR